MGMATVDIEVNGRAYRLLCEPGQENRIRELAAYVEARLKVVTGGRSGSDAHMLLATCLVLADELQDVMSGREVLTGRGMVSAAVPEEELEGMAASVDGLTRRIEEVAERLERA
jgi:cell division protein ZapA